MDTCYSVSLSLDDYKDEYIILSLDSLGQVVVEFFDIFDLSSQSYYRSKLHIEIEELVLFNLKKGVEKDGKSKKDAS